MVNNLIKRTFASIGIVGMGIVAGMIIANYSITITTALMILGFVLLLGTFGHAGWISKTCNHPKNINRAIPALVFLSLVIVNHLFYYRGLPSLQVDGLIGSIGCMLFGAYAYVNSHAIVSPVYVPLFRYRPPECISGHKADVFGAIFLAAPAVYLGMVTIIAR